MAGTENLLWIGKERVNRLPGAYSFIAIGALKAACNPGALAASGVSHVVNAGAFAYDRHSDITYFDIEVLDCMAQCKAQRSSARQQSEDSDLSRWFTKCSDFIDQARASGGLILVHCRAGRSRSAALVTAYLIERGRMKLDEAMALLRSTRAIAQPNKGFIEQLKELEEELEEEHKAAETESGVPGARLRGGGDGAAPADAPSRRKPRPDLGQVVYCSRSGRIKRGIIVRVRDGGVSIHAGGTTYSGVEGWLREAEFEKSAAEDGKSDVFDRDDGDDLEQDSHGSSAGEYV